MREFNYTMTQALSVGLRSTDRNKRNSQALVLSDGVFPDSGALGSLEGLTPIDISALDPVPVFPYPQLFELLQIVLVCTDVAIYSYANETLTLELGSLTAGHRWSVADFGSFIVLANGKQTVYRDATSKAWSTDDTYGIGSSSGICDLNGQLIVAAPNTTIT